jgi:hypothetical protein
MLELLPTKRIGIVIPFHHLLFLRIAIHFSNGMVIPQTKRAGTEPPWGLGGPRFSPKKKIKKIKILLQILLFFLILTPQNFFF